MSAAKAPLLSPVAWQQVRELQTAASLQPARFRATSANRTVRGRAGLTAVVSEGEVGALAGEAETVRSRLLILISCSYDSDNLKGKGEEDKTAEQKQ